MPICNKCNSNFPTRIWIDGRLRNLQNRKRCLICSPFGEKIKNSDGTKEVCEECSGDYIYNHKSANTKKICNACATRSRRLILKNKMIIYKGGKCSKCGYNKCARALEFHHRDASEKNFMLSAGYYIQWNKVILELNKCDLLCSNCHKELEEELDSVRRTPIVLDQVDI